MRRAHPGQIPAGGVHDALGLAGGARGVEQVQHVLGVHRLGLDVRVGVLDEVVPPHVAIVLPVDLLAGALVHDDRAHERALLERLVGVLLERHLTAAAPAPVRGDDDLRLAIVDAVAQRLRREAAEDHAVRRPDAGARQHGDRQLGDHRHVDGDGVALLDPVLAEGGGEAVHLAIHVPVRQHARVARLAFPDERRLVAARALDVPIEAVVGDVELAADEPLRVGQLPLLRLLPGLHPPQLFGLLLPEAQRIGLGLLVDRRALDAGRPGELLRRWELPSFLQEGLDGLVALSGLRHG